MNTDDCITEILDRWKEAEQQGTPLSIDELCADWPELRKEVERQINALLEDNERFRHAPTVVFSADENSNNISNDISNDTVSTQCELTSLKFHAKGGLGSVYRAKDEQVHRDVAVKFIHQKLVADRVSRDRFALEAEITGRLEHPGVVPLYGIGESEHGRSFYTMRFIDGETLDQAIAENHGDQQQEENASQRRLRFRELLTHLVSACKTVAYAHTRGIVHRDIKPDNIMLGRYGETTVLDWGLAMPVSRGDRFKESGEETLIPSSGKSRGLSGGAGTPAYMRSFSP